MDNYQPPFTVNNEMLMLVSRISENIGRIAERNALNTKPHLKRDYRIRSIHSSLAIEANSLTLEETRAVIDGNPVIGPEKEIREVQNAYKAYEQIPAIDPYKESDLLHTHKIMMDQIIADSGNYRHGNEGVFNGDVCVFMAPPPDMVPELMRQLFTWMKENKGKIHPLILSSVFHYEFVFIHPFSDGNGRMARLWQTSLLYRWKDIFQYIPLESQIQNFQDGYYQAISECHKNGNSDVFILFMLQRIDEILMHMLSEESLTGNDQLARTARLLSLMENRREYTAMELMQLLHLKSRRGLQGNYLHPAIETGKIQMTDPEHPRSKNQKYKRLQ